VPPGKLRRHRLPEKGPVKAAEVIELARSPRFGSIRALGYKIGYRQRRMGRLPIADSAVSIDHYRHGAVRRLADSGELHLTRKHRPR